MQDETYLQPTSTGSSNTQLKPGVGISADRHPASRSAPANANRAITPDP